MNENNPFYALRDIADRSRQVSLKLPAKEHAQTHWNGLGFSLLGQRFVVPMGEVSEIMRIPQQATRLPGVKSFVNGVANVRGRLLIVIDLAMFFGTSSTLPRTQRRILALENDENYLGFMVDESLGMQHFPSEGFIDSVDDVDPRFKAFVTGGYSVGGSAWPVLSLRTLAEDPNLETLAA